MLANVVASCSTLSRHPTSRGRRALPLQRAPLASSNAKVGDARRRKHLQHLQLHPEDDRRHPWTHRAHQPGRSYTSWQEPVGIPGSHIRIGQESPSLPKVYRVADWPGGSCGREGRPVNRWVAPSATDSNTNSVAPGLLREEPRGAPAASRGPPYRGRPGLGGRPTRPAGMGWS